MGIPFLYRDYKTYHSNGIPNPYKIILKKFIKESKVTNQRFFRIDWPRLETDRHKPKLTKFTNIAVLP